jgi:MFS-type transporter involved in bile tolerance (Atg22 family)
MTNRTSSIIGPNVVQAIIGRTGDTWQGFTFLFASCLASGLVIWLAVDVSKGRSHAAHWAAEHRHKAPSIWTERRKVST